MKKTTGMHELRQGTRCKFCNKYIEDNDYIIADGGSLGAVVYAHRDCCKKHAYNYSQLTSESYHQETETKFSYVLELITDTDTDESERLALYSRYKLVNVSANSNTEYFRGNIIQSLAGVKSYFKQVQKIINITGVKVYADSETLKDLIYPEIKIDYVKSILNSLETEFQITGSSDYLKLFKSVSYDDKKDCLVFELGEALMADLDHCMQLIRLYTINADKTHSKVWYNIPVNHLCRTANYYREERNK